MKPAFYCINVIKLITSREYGTGLGNVSIKIDILRDFLHTKEAADALSREALAEIAASDEERFLPAAPAFILDGDGDIALSLSYAVGMLISGASQGCFSSVLALILILETCYQPTVGFPNRLNAALQRFRPLIQREGPSSAALLHEFLEVEEFLESWFSHHLHAHRMVRDKDYIYAPPENCLTENLCMDDVVRTIMLSPMMAKNMACTTPTVRGRKVRAFLLDLSVSSCDYTENDPALVELLFSPPTRGTASL